MAKTTCFGIDLGTTYSAVSYINETGQPDVISDGTGALTPSVVYFGEDGIVVGSAAKEKGGDGGKDARRVVSFVKRAMPPVEEGSGETDRFKSPWVFDGKSYTPVDVSAQILRKLKDDAVKLEQADIQKVFVTVPEFFESTAVERTREAAKKGLGLSDENIRIISEPVAAALNYALATGEEIEGKTFIVYDLGGGTFDITVLTIEDTGNGKTLYKVVYTDGNHYLGGGNWDDRIVDFFKEEFHNQTRGLSISEESAEDLDEFYRLEFDLRITAEKVKVGLSESNSATRTIRFNGKSARIALTRQKFDEITKDLREETFVFVDKAIEGAKEKGVTRFDAFLLVGGSTYMPQITEGLLARTANDPAFKEVKPIYHDPNRAVVKGAARMASVWTTQLLFKKIKETEGTTEERAAQKVAEIQGLTTAQIRKNLAVTVVDNTPMSYGIKTLNTNCAPHSTRDEDYHITNLIPKGTPCAKGSPARGEHIFHPTFDGQPGAFFEIWENHFREPVTESLEGCHVRPKNAFGYVRFSSRMELSDEIKVELEVNEEKLFFLYATDMRNGERFPVELLDEKKN